MEEPIIVIMPPSRMFDWLLGLFD